MKESVASLLFQKKYLQEKIGYLQNYHKDHDEKLRKCINLEQKDAGQKELPLARVRRICQVIIAINRLKALSTQRKYVEELEEIYPSEAIKYKKVAIVYQRGEKPYLIDKTRQFINNILNENNKLDWKLKDLMAQLQEKEKQVVSLQENIHC